MSWSTTSKSAPAGCRPASPPLSHSEEPESLKRNDAHETTELSAGGAKQWIHVPLQTWSLYLFIITSIALITTILALLIVSLRQTGFATIGSALSAYGATWRLSPFWTALPSLVFTRLGLHWGALASAASDRQRFVDLHRPDGGAAKETVLLDYRATMAPIRWWAAFRNGHWLAGSSLLAALVFSVLSPLAASLFVATAAPFRRKVCSLQQHVRPGRHGLFHGHQRHPERRHGHADLRR
jgi:hypothetical protein